MITGSCLNTTHTTVAVSVECLKKIATSNRVWVCIKLTNALSTPVVSIKNFKSFYKMRNFLKERETKPSGLSSGWRGLTIKKFERDLREKERDAFRTVVEQRIWLNAMLKGKLGWEKPKRQSVPLLLAPPLAARWQHAPVGERERRRGWEKESNSSSRKKGIKNQG